MLAAGAVNLGRARRPLRLGEHMLVLVVLSLLPMLALCVALIEWATQVQRAAIGDEMQRAANTMSHAVDLELRASEAALLAVVSGDPRVPTDTLRDRVGGIAARHRWSAVVLVDDGGKHFTPLVPAGPGPVQFDAAPRYTRAALRAGKPIVSGVYPSPLSGRLVTAIHAPIGDSDRTIAAVVPAERWTAFLQAHDVPPGWVAGLVDADGAVVARTRGADRFVGRPAPEWVTAALRSGPQGRVTGPAFEGESVWLAFHRSPFSGWSVALAAPTAVFERPLRRSIEVAIGAGLAFTLAAGALAWLYAQRIMRPVRQLAASAQALGRDAKQLPPLASSAVAEVNELYSALSAAARAAAEASAMKSRFLADMSHELRTPLNAIIGFSGVLRDGVAGPVNDRQREYAAEVVAAGEHLLSLIDDALDLSKVEAGHIALHVQPVELAPLIESSLAAMRQIARPRGIRLQMRIGPALEEVPVDERRLRQVLYNLLSNAVKFSPEGSSVTVEARRVDRQELQSRLAAASTAAAPLRSDAAAFCEISVRDTGPGIPERDLPLLFQPFVQLDNGDGHPHEGTGLGLVLVKTFVLLHGGTVAVDTAPGRGTCFLAWFPLAQAAAPAAPAH